MRPVRIALIAVAGAVVVAAGAASVALASFDPNSFKPDIIAAVKHATGRDLALNGKIGIKLSLTPTIQVADATFSNPPGFSRPQMATLQGMELRFALLPLLSRQLQIDRLLLIHPDILLETDTAGRSNWQMTPEVQPSAPPGSQAPAPGPGKGRTAVSVDTIRIQDGIVAYRDDRTANVTTIGLAKLDASAESPDSPMHLDMDGRYGGTAFNLVADTGPAARLQDPAATSPWPVKLALTVASARLAAEGALTQPLQGKGYNLGVNGVIPDLSILTPLLQGVPLPSLRDVTFAAQVADKGGKLPDVSSLSLHAGASDLGAQVSGLALTKLDVDAAVADQPLEAKATGQLGGVPLALAATLGTPALLAPDAKPAPFPIDITLLAGGARISAKGSVADAKAMTGVNVNLSAQVPDLAALSPLVRRPLPPLKQVAFQATAADTTGGLRNGVVMRAVNLTSSNGDLTGDASVILQPRTTLTANLASKRLDLDALNETPAAEASAPPKDVSPQRAAKSARLFPDNPLPFERLRALDADIHLAIASLRAGGAETKAVIVHANVKDSKLSVDRFAADPPGGHLTGTLVADAAPALPPVHLVVHAPGLALASLLAAAHQPPLASGNLEIDADLSGVGASPHALAGSLNGVLSLALAGGTVDNRILGSVLGKVIDSVNALDLVGRGGTSELRCFALRMESRNGTGTVQPLALSSSLLTMTGGGTVNLGNETLGMTIRPQVRMGGASLLVPMKLTGPMRSPAVTVDRLGAAESNAGTVAGAVLNGNTSLGGLGGLFASDKLLGGKAGDICAPALAAARGQPIPASTAQNPPANTTEPKLPDLGATLKSLLQ